MLSDDETVSLLETVRAAFVVSHLTATFQHCHICDRVSSPNTEIRFAAMSPDLPGAMYDHRLVILDVDSKTGTLLPICRECVRTQMGFSLDLGF